MTSIRSMERLRRRADRAETLADLATHLPRGERPAIWLYNLHIMWRRRWQAEMNRTIQQAEAHANGAHERGL